MTNADIWKKLDDLLSMNPIVRGTGVSALVITEAERDLGRPFSCGYREFLRRYGAAMVGAVPILGLSKVEVLGDDWWNVVKVTRHFWDDGWVGTHDWYVISTDGSGNPVGIDTAGHVWISDHDVGKVEMLADDFETWLDSLLTARASVH